MCITFIILGSESATSHSGASSSQRISHSRGQLWSECVRRQLSQQYFTIDPFVLSVCPEIWLRIPSLSICFLRICMINLAMCMLQLKFCSGISTDTIYYSISRWQRTTEFFFSTHKPQNLLIHTYRTKSSTTTTWQDLRSPNLHPTNPT